MASVVFESKMKIVLGKCGLSLNDCVYSAMWYEFHFQQKLLFCNYPFTFDAGAKTVLLQTDAMMQMQVGFL